MIISKIKIDIELLQNISSYTINNLYLINIFKEGICITQNIDNSSNFSFFISKKLTNLFDIKYEKNFVTTDLLELENLEILFVNDKYLTNNKISNVNNACNICKNLIRYKKNSMKINYNDINFSHQKLNFLENKELSLIISKQFNGIVLRYIDNNEIVLFINTLY